MPHLFPLCRHRREPRHRGVYHCRSPKMLGLRLVTPDFCHQCPFQDHHSFAEEVPLEPVTPGMPVEALMALLEGPVRAWPHGWEDWPLTRAAHALLAQRFLADLPPYPE